MPPCVAPPSVEDGLLAWARSQRQTQKGRRVQWTRSTEAELHRLEAVAYAQVSSLVPLLSSVVVRQKLACEGLVAPHEAHVITAEEMAKNVLVQLLRARAAWIVGEDPAADGDLRKEREFDDFLMQQVGCS
mmetsp:Transcript_53501/g.124538  ORF Transcript_53501/g.124538 Transcript_53501/m.124538 type:complete len:131 (-) Transcript_53501:130-522(-)